MTKAKAKNDIRKKCIGYARSSLKIQSREFFENSTLHGVKYIAADGRPFYERLLWFACVSVGSIATIVIIFSLWEKFQVNPTITGLDTDFHNWEVPFPGIIICQEVPANVTDIQEFLQTEYGDAKEGDVNFLLDLTKLTLNTVPQFVKKYDKETRMRFGTTNTRELVYKLFNKCENVFDTCTWKIDVYDCCKEFKPLLTENGFCYAFNTRNNDIDKRSNRLPDKKYIKETDLKWSLNFSVKYEEGLSQIYILDSDEIPGVDTQPQHVWNFKVSKISFSVKETYTTENTRQLSVRQRHCLFADEVQLKVDRIYTYSECTRECRMDRALSKCGCVPYFYPPLDSYPRCSLEQLECIAVHLDEITAVRRCKCYLGCSNTVYEIEKLEKNTDVEKVQSIEAEFVSWPMVRYKREVLFGWVDLLVSFGGIAGLFLGLSLLSGVEIFYYFVIRSAYIFTSKKDMLERHQAEEKLRKKIDYDLNLVPYFIGDPLPGKGINEFLGGAGALSFDNAKSNFQPGKNTRKANKTNLGMLPPFGIDFVN